MHTTLASQLAPRTLLCGLLIPALVFGFTADTASADRAEGTNRYLGRYRLHDDLVLVVGQYDPTGPHAGILYVQPSFWRSRIPLETDPTAAVPDAFRSRLNPEMKFHFEVDPSGHVAELEASGHRQVTGRATRLPPSERLPVELLLAGEGAASFAALEAVDPEGAERAIGIAQRHLRSFPSRAEVSVDFARALAKRYPNHAEAQATLGMALVQAGNRPQAQLAFRAALELAADHEFAQLALRHLFTSDPDRPGPAASTPLPFSLDSLFAPPSPREARVVRETWKARDLTPSGVELVDQFLSTQTHGTFEVSILSQRIHGFRHYSAIFVPQNAASGCCPLVVDVRGVSWDYAPLDLTDGPRSMQVLAEDSAQFLFAVPSLRGEVLEIEGRRYTSEGNRRRGWDGGADDVISLLGATLETIPAVDEARICAFGKSRGASVALLAAARDSRFGCVVAWAGPADWFESMGSFGWTLQELVTLALEQQWVPGQGWGSAAQFVERVLENPSARGQRGLAASRLLMLASSPLYFVDSLPAASLHYGSDDGSVGIANAWVLEAALAASSGAASERSLTVHRGAGHDMPWPEAYETSRDFLLRHLAPNPKPTP